MKITSIDMLALFVNFILVLVVKEQYGWLVALIFSSALIVLYGTAVKKGWSVK